MGIVDKPIEKRFGAPAITKADVSGADEGDDDGEDDGEDGGLNGAAKDILEAIRDNDHVALASALKLAHGHCSDETESGDYVKDENKDPGRAD